MGSSTFNLSHNVNSSIEVKKQQTPLSPKEGINN